MNTAAKDYLKTKVCGPDGKTCDKYFIHGVGHTVGLEVHDAGHSQSLKPGFVITNEPGIYIPDDPETHLPIGVRIEDTLLITETGYETLSPPYHTADEVEAAMAGSK
jgi:Xaa-Pro aminopeptidase